MAVLGIGKVGRTSVIMDTDVDGLGWAENRMMVTQNGKKR